MKNYFSLITLLVLCHSIGFSQSYFAQVNSIKNKKSTDTQSLSAISVNSPWFGAQATYQVGRNTEIADNFAPTARGAWEITSFFEGKLVLPSVFNIGMLRNLSSDFEDKKEEYEANIQELTNSTQGIHIGLAPYFLIVDEDKFKVTIHSNINAKINGFKSSADAETEYLIQGRLGVGSDIAVGENYPLTFSICPTYTFFDPDKYEDIFEKRKTELWGLEVSTIIPIGSKIGGVVNLYFCNDADFFWDFGVVIATK